MVAHRVVLSVSDPISPVVAFCSVSRGVFTLTLATDCEKEGFTVMGADRLMAKTGLTG